MTAKQGKLTGSYMLKKKYGCQILNISDFQNSLIYGNAGFLEIWKLEFQKILKSIIPDFWNFRFSKLMIHEPSNHNTSTNLYNFSIFD